MIHWLSGWWKRFNALSAFDNRQNPHANLILSLLLALPLGVILLAVFVVASADPASRAAQAVGVVIIGLMGGLLTLALNLAVWGARRAETRWHNVVRRVPVGMYLYQLEPGDRLVLTSANPAADALTGISHSDLIGLTIEQAFPPLADTPLPDIYRRIAAAGGTWQAEQFAYSSSQINGIFEVYAFQTGPGRMVAAFFEITERKKAQEALAHSEEIFRVVVENSPSGVFMIDDAYRFVYANSELCHILGRPHDQIVGADFRDMLDGAERDLVADRYQRRQRGEAVPNRYELTIVTGAGDRKRVEMAVSAITDSEGRLRSMGQVVDATDRIEAEQRRLELALEKEKLEMIRTFVSNITHDLKTPLTAIQTSLYLLERHTDPERRQEKMATIREQAALLGRLIQNLLTISRLDYLPELSRAPVDLNEVSQQIARQFRPWLERKRLRVELALAPDLPAVSADREALARAITNLLENAINYTPEGQAICLHTSCQGGEVVLEVTDTGIGINPNDLPYIFNRFYRAEQARAAVSSGSGLGLAIVKRIVDMHAGRIEVESVLGTGSTFRIALPGIFESAPM